MSESRLWKIGESIKTIVAALPSEVGSVSSMFDTVIHGYQTPNDSSSAKVPYACVDVAREISFDDRQDGINGYLTYPLRIYAYFKRVDSDVEKQTKQVLNYYSVLTRAIANLHCNLNYNDEDYFEDVVITMQSFAADTTVPEPGRPGTDMELQHPYYAVVCELLVRVNTMVI